MLYFYVLQIVLILSFEADVLHIMTIQSCSIVSATSSLVLELSVGCRNRLHDDLPLQGLYISHSHQTLKVKISCRIVILVFATIKKIFHGRNANEAYSPSLQQCLFQYQS